jgi:DNA repair protein RecO (recombination protein O)
MAFKTEAFVLKTIDWREADRLYYLFTPHEGLITAILRSAAKPQNKLAGHLPAFAKVKVMIGRGKQDHLAGTQLITDYANLRTDLRNLSLAASIVELFLGEVSTGPKWKEFQLLEEIFTLLNDDHLQADQKLSLVRAFLWKFLSMSGWQPQLDHCLVCKQAVESGFYWPGNGIVCAEHKTPNALSMSHDLLQFLREILSRPLSDILDLSIKKELNREWLQASQAYYHEVYERPSRALKLFIYG